MVRGIQCLPVDVDRFRTQLKSVIKGFRNREDGRMQVVQKGPQFVQVVLQRGALSGPGISCMQK